MSLKEQIHAKALLVAGELDERRGELLRMLCAAVAAELTVRLKEGIVPEECMEELAEGGSLLALAALGSAGEEAAVQEFQAGDLKVKLGGVTASGSGLQLQGERLLSPYLKQKDAFAFLGV